MTVNEWFINKGSHRQGLDILLSLGESVFDVLEWEQPTTANKMEVRYALSKHRTAPKKSDKVDYSSMPAELRKVWQEKSQLFYHIADCHLKLTKLKPQEEEKALELQQIIYSGYIRLDQLWEQIDYWKVHRCLIPVPDDIGVDKMSAIELLKARKNTQNRIYNRRATIQKNEKELSTIKDKRKFHYKQASLNKRKTDLLKQEQLLIQINERIQKTT